MPHICLRRRKDISLKRAITAQTIKIIKTECANCIDNGFCVIRDQACPQIAALRAHKETNGKKLQLCQWFHDAVLLDPKYKWLAEQLSTGHNNGTVYCQRCGNPIVRNSNRQVFCLSCAETERKLSKAKVMRNLSAKKNHSTTWSFRQSEALINQRFQNMKS